MRVIAGSAGGLPLVAPKKGVRPTMDRVKAAIFSSLGDAIIDANVLDLFAGSGALGIEALSRGAASAVFVDEDRQSIAAIEKNLAKTKLKGRVRQENVFDFLRRTGARETSSVILSPSTSLRTSSAQRSRRIPPHQVRHGNPVDEKFKIIFADPPYEKTKSGERFTEMLLANEGLPSLLEIEGVFVLEKQPGEALPEMKLWNVLRQKTYGATEVLFLSPLRPALCAHE